MDNYIESYIKSIYGFDINNCSKEELLKITQINARDVTGIRQYDEKFDWDFSKLTNLKTIDCSYNTIDSIDISQNILLEEICWMGVRGKLSKPIDLSHNVNLKKIVGGQDGLIKLDLSNNTKLEEIMILNSLSLRWINLDNCLNLKKIIMNGVNIPFVDKTINYVELKMDKMKNRKCTLEENNIQLPSDRENEVLNRKNLQQKTNVISKPLKSNAKIYSGSLRI